MRIVDRRLLVITIRFLNFISFKTGRINDLMEDKVKELLALLLKTWQETEIRVQAIIDTQNLIITELNDKLKTAGVAVGDPETEKEIQDLITGVAAFNSNQGG